MTSADRCSIFLVDYENGELEAHFDQETAVRMPIKSGVAGYVAQTKQSVNLEDAYTHPSFNRMVDELTGYTTQSLLCVPVYYEGNLVAVAQVVLSVYSQCFVTGGGGGGWMGGWDRGEWQQWLLLGAGLQQRDLFPLFLSLHYSALDAAVAVRRMVFNRQQLPRR